MTLATSLQQLADALTERGHKVSRLTVSACQTIGQITLQSAHPDRAAPIIRLRIAGATFCATVAGPRLFSEAFVGSVKEISPGVSLAIPSAYSFSG